MKKVSKLLHLILGFSAGLLAGAFIRLGFEIIHGRPAAIGGEALILPLVILLCIFGVVMDFLVYLIRWQPYRVWGNFWTRFLPKRARRTPTGRHLIYADGTMIEEEQVVQHKPKPAPKREGTAATRRKRVIPARRAHFGTTQTELTPPPLTIAQDKNQYHDNIPGGQA